ncbi:hypothetical protein AGABI2DRAFT_194076 [Agaricus bisporus var. bisporus H97]|uniref:hypothetical protein n=1 Tax=Agaricus bisporus var. bisporus (strain H97 / ATCC MYA-4626 / FGSC 10389) TaxID=936046 RepID=UPI00029F779A|nr:hypothetical protein AGABI2DRAFT_194076 [Agaricus bisporus var. bisporus H97]EKV44962.1 hypothetical protein AGABI2DRAFT_194076 [Agaricus bisporus var. bisporus H97]
MSTLRNKSKLSVLLYDSSDLDSSDPALPTTPRPPSDSQHGMKIQPARKATVSRLCFPFVKSVPKQAAKSAPSEVAISPSVTSPPVSVPTPTPYTHALTSTLPFVRGPHHNSQRHNYRHRGYSRHALAHIKWFWVSREEDWETRKGPIRSSKPRLHESFIETALDDPFTSSLESSGHKWKTPLHPVHQQQLELPPLTIHPRRGDLASLRDPYSAEIDRAFVGFPMWTIGKTLWMHDVHLASQERLGTDLVPVDVLDIYDDTASECDSQDTQGSVVDDSDATLVDSETESEMSSPEIGAIDQDVRPSFRKSSWSHSAYSEPSPLSTSVSSSGKLLNSRSLWTMDSHRCWDCMIEVSHRPH